MKLKAILLSLCCASGLISSTLFAKEINMYDQPIPNAKIVSKADSSTGIIPIFSPRNSDWVKIADPRTGNVGWVKTADINAQNVAVIQKIVVNPTIADLKTPMPVDGNRAINLPGGPVSSAEMQQAMQRMQMQQMRVQQSTEQLMQATMRYLNMMFEEQAALMGVNTPTWQGQDQASPPPNAINQPARMHPPRPMMNAPMQMPMPMHQPMNQSMNPKTTSGQQDSNMPQPVNNNR